MSRAFAGYALFACMLLAACKAGVDPEGPGRAGGQGSGAGASGGSGGRGGTVGNDGTRATGGGSGAGTGGSPAGTDGSPADTGGSPAGTGGSPAGTGGSAADTGGTGADALAGDGVSDAETTSTDGPGPGGAGAESAHLPGRPDLKICRKEWTAAQCCEFLCACLTNICSDSPKGKPGIPTCMQWCPKLGDMARRCHVYHCYVSISPTGGIKDHDSHCGHAADQVPGGGCPTEVYRQP
jgi:hypothetical protein